jgi:hypothetical protein
MAGTALLPWEEWIARLLHPLYVAIRRTLHSRHRRHELRESEGWPQAEGTIMSKSWDSSLPREELLYSYSTPAGYYSGSHWLWFERSEPHEVKVGDQILLRYCPDSPERSVFLKFD